jgi:hypothetical protein
MNSKKRKLRNHDLRSEGYNLLKAEGNEWLHRGASPNTKTFGPKGYHFRRAEGGDRLPGSINSKIKTFGKRTHDLGRG